MIIHRSAFPSVCVSSKIWNVAADRSGSAPFICCQAHSDRGRNGAEPDSTRADQATRTIGGAGSADVSNGQPAVEDVRDTQYGF
jgi:hypothetical protein